MELTQHPEYDMYVRAREAERRCRQAIAAWWASGEPIVVPEYALRWTFQEAQAFVRSLACMFQAYNRVLWEQFPYCRRCGGQCCTLHATHIGTFDLMAMALLGQTTPTLPERIRATERDCIYLTATGCAWPVEWRPIKCWAFYCALGEDNSALVEELEQVILAFTPEPLRRYEVAWGDPLVAYLDDPVDLAEALNDALFEIFVAPFNDRLPVIEDTLPPDHSKNADAQESDLPDATSELLAFIAEVTEQICASPLSIPKESSISADQLLDDLESLEWIALGRPTNGAKLLAEMHLRYAAAPPPRDGERATIWYRMRRHISHLRRNWQN
jgi:hypothetical protein